MLLAALVLYAALLALVGLVVYGIVVYNGLVSLRNEVRRAWANVDVLLKQRADEVPRLVEVVKGYAAHERALFETVADSRARMLAAGSVREKGAADADVRGGVAGLLALAEAYPQLKADASFLALQRRLSALESDIADRRELYNDTVTEFNVRIETLPDALVARRVGMTERAPLFQATAEERAVVPV